MLRSVLHAGAPPGFEKKLTVTSELVGSLSLQLANDRYKCDVDAQNFVKFRRVRINILLIISYLSFDICYAF